MESQAGSETRNTDKTKGGNKGRNGATMGGLEADPWHCLSFKKKSSVLSLTARCLSWVLCIAS